MRSVMPVGRTTKGSIGRPGLTSVENRSTTSPPSSLRLQSP